MNIPISKEISLYGKMDWTTSLLENESLDEEVAIKSALCLRLLAQNFV